MRVPRINPSALPLQVVAMSRSKSLPAAKRVSTREEPVVKIFRHRVLSGKIGVAKKALRRYLESLRRVQPAVCYFVGQGRRDRTVFVRVLIFPGRSEQSRHQNAAYTKTLDRLLAEVAPADPIVDEYVAVGLMFRALGPKLNL